MSRRISLTPWARQALPPADEARLAGRAAVLGAYVSVVADGSGWRLDARYAGADGPAVELRAKGSLAAAIAGALDDLEAVA